MPNFTQRYANLKLFSVEQMTYLNPRAAILEEKKLSRFEVYVALVKGYCAILILVLPKAFVTGGYLTTALLVMVSCFVSTLCAALLV